MSSRGGGEEAPHESGSLACSNVQLLGRTRSGLSLRCNALQCTVGRSAGENERREENNWIIGRGTHVLVYLVFGIIDPCYSSVLGRHWKAWTSRETGTLKISRLCSPQHRRGAAAGEWAPKSWEASKDDKTLAPSRDPMCAGRGRRQQLVATEASTDHRAGGVSAGRCLCVGHTGTCGPGLIFSSDSKSRSWGSPSALGICQFGRRHR